MEFVEAKHKGVEGTALLPASAFKHMPGWSPVDPGQSVPSLVDGTIPQVLALVGDDRTKAAAALAAEQARPHPRTTLVDALTTITADTQES